MTMNALLLPIVLAATAAPAPAAEPLTIGSPSPKLAPMKFVRGDAVKELSRGTIYVIEFSGTQCGPCLKCVPHLNELQKKYPAVVFISVYSGEEEKVVRTFLAGPGKDIAFRVAADPAGAMLRDWSDPACREGIPDVIVAGKDGKVAWIGRPWDLDDPLARIVAGTFDPHEDEYEWRLKLEQAVVLRARRVEERKEKGLREYSRINDLAKAGKLDAALADTEKALATFRDCPSTSRLLLNMRLCLLAGLPDRREEVFRLATEEAVAAKVSGNSFAVIGTASTLLNAADGAAPGTRDKRLINLAVALLRDPSLGGDQIDKEELLGWAYHLRGDATGATGAIRKALTMVRGLKPPAGADEAASFAENTRQRLRRLEATLEEYSRKAPPPQGNRHPASRKDG
jgi:hypothetical protein